MEYWELVARESIRDLVARYNSYGDSGRFDDIVALFASDGVMDVDGVVYRGREEIRAMFVTAAWSLRGRPEFRGVRHCTSTLQIDVGTEETASARCYYFVLLGDGIDHFGRYVDEFKVVDGRWCFACRREKLDGAGPGSWAASVAPEPPSSSG